MSGDAGDLAPPPYGLVDNAESLLAHSDLVFIDPVGTGYSRAAKNEKPDDHHGFQADIESVGEVIRLWTTRNGRWLSPKFLAGESYGTTRAGGLAHHLQNRHGLYLNGLVLISAVLEFGSLDFTAGNDLPYSTFLPTYAAIAHYHGLLGDRPLADVLSEAEEFASRDYPWALAQGNRLSAEDRAATITRLAPSPGCPRTSWTASTCGSSTSGSTPSCCGTAARPSAGWTAGSSAGTPTTAASTGRPTRRSPRSPARTRRRSTTTSARSSSTRTTCRTRC